MESVGEASVAARMRNFLMALKPVAIVLLLGCGVCFLNEPFLAAGTKRKPAQPDPALPTVEKVLRAEVAGQIDRRRQLAETLRQQPDWPSARWQAGFVKEGDS